MVVMMAAGELSGDLLAAEWVAEFRRIAGPVPPEFFGMGGPKMARAGVELAVDLTSQALIGLPTVGEYRRLHRVREKLVKLAVERQPDVLVCIDFFGFNRSLASRIREVAGEGTGPFSNWRPKIVQYVSPQVWASRPWRARRMPTTHDLLLSILPFESAWYAKHAPGLRVEFVGHPVVDRHCAISPSAKAQPPVVLLLPGSRPGELARHLPVVLEAARRLVREFQVIPRLVLSPAVQWSPLQSYLSQYPEVEVQSGGLERALSQATLALACTGTVTLECAWHGVPTVAFYRTSPTTYTLGKRLVTVRYLAMPNLLACGVGLTDRAGSQPVMPEFIQGAATPENLANAAAKWLRDPNARDSASQSLRRVCTLLGEPNASLRAAISVQRLLGSPD